MSGSKKIRLLQSAVIKDKHYDSGHEFDWTEKREQYLDDNFIRFEIVGCANAFEQWQLDKKIKGTEAYKEWEFFPTKKSAFGILIRDNAAVDEHFKRFKKSPKRKNNGG